MDDIMPAKNARNMALFFTFLGAASYMHGAAPVIPDPNDMINTENVAALRDALLKMGLAGGVLKTMKEAAAKSVGSGDRSSLNSADRTVSNNDEDATSRAPESGERSRSLEDLSHMVPTSIRSRLYNAFSPSSSLPNVSSIDRLSEQKEDNIDRTEQDKAGLPLTRQHRSKRSHSTKCLFNVASESNVDENKPMSVPAVATHQQKASYETLTPVTNENTKMMKQPVSSNPYDHPSLAANANAEIKPSSLFSFNESPDNFDGTSKTNDSPDSRETPSGCVGGKFSQYFLIQFYQEKYIFSSF